MDQDIELEEMPIEAEFAGEHAETLIEGLIDTVTGAESYNGGLTEAQQYLVGALSADGVSFHNVHGTEGVMDTVKAGLFKVMETIKRAFKAIWSFFTDKKITNQAKSVFDTAKQFRQTADERFKGYKGDISGESIKVRLGMIEKMEKLLDKAADDALGKITELPENMVLMNPVVKEMKPMAAEIRESYGLSAIITGIRKVADLKTASTKLEEVAKKIDANNTKMLHFKNKIDGEISRLEGLLNAKNFLVNRKESEDILKVLKPISGIFGIYIQATQRKMNMVDKLMKGLPNMAEGAKTE